MLDVGAAFEKAQVDEDGSFRFYAPATFFEKADAAEGQRLRIRGICTTDDLDKDQERVLADGLDFGLFGKSGWFNDNHSKSTADVVGYPDPQKFAHKFKKGAKLPDGTVAKSNGWWTEGYLVGDRGRAIFSLAKELADTGRQLGFSIEGKVDRRADGGKTIAKAVVRNVAVTHCPVNPYTGLQALAKSLADGRLGGADNRAETSQVSKALAVGNAIANPGAAPGQGFALRQESLEGRPPRNAAGGGSVRRIVRRKKKRWLNKSDGVAFLRQVYPALSPEQASAAYDFAAGGI